MYALAVEYKDGLAGAPPLAVRWAYRELLAGQPGYRRRLELQADGYRRLVEVFLFADGAAAGAALASPARDAFAAAHPGCADTTPALLVREEATDVVLLRRSAATTRNGCQGCWRDYLAPAALGAELW